MANTYNPDANSFVGVPTVGAVSPRYPLWMYHPVYQPIIVVNSVAEAALITSDSRWSEVPYNAASAASASSVLASPAAFVNDYSPAGWGPTISRLIAAPPSGGSTWSGLSAIGFADNSTVYLRNPSATDSINLLHASAGSLAANRFSCPQGVTAVLQPLTGAILRYVVNQWVFQ